VLENVDKCISVSLSVVEAIGLDVECMAFGDDDVAVSTNGIDIFKFISETIAVSAVSVVNI
jgi:hypothetical protein